jgi:Pyruvate/2-oxoacid:ferredoxin oxidoreductase gamma subunit
MSDEKIAVEQGSEEPQQETSKEMFGNLTGLTKKVAIKIYNSDLADNVKKNLNNRGIKDSSDALRKVVEIGAEKSVKGIGRKFTIVLSIIIAVIAAAAVIVTLVTKGNIIIPIIIFAVLILITWLITGKIFKMIARKISGKIYKAIEGRVKAGMQKVEKKTEN